MDVEFNHLYVTLDAESVQAVGESQFLASQFCNLTTTKVEADDESWTGTYLLGKRSYLELFGPGGMEGLREGFAGIGFSTRRMGQIDEIEERLEKLVPGKIRRDLRIRKGADGEVPWFHYLYIEDSDDGGFFSWLLEYHPDYLASKDIHLGESGLIDRAAYLRPETEDESYNLLLDDIHEVEIEITLQEHNVLKILLRAFGYGSSSNGGVVSYRSGEFVLKVTETSAPTYRIRKATCSLTAGAGVEREISFGDGAKLSIKNGSALWLFGPTNRFNE